MKVLKEEITPCNCYGCLKKSTCQCINCGLKKMCKISFCMKEKLNQYTFECNICFSKFRTLDYLKKHRKKSNHRLSLPSPHVVDCALLHLGSAPLAVRERRALPPRNVERERRRGVDDRVVGGRVERMHRHRVGGARDERRLRRGERRRRSSRGS